jgi:SAM-dependent methyltransferase
MRLPVFEYPPSLSYRLQQWLKKPLPSKWHSVALKLRYLLAWVEDTAFAKTRGLDFSGYISPDDLVTEFPLSQPHSCFYQAVSCRHVRELIREGTRTIGAFENFVDIGSGMGKACFYASTRPFFRQIVGIEFSKPLVLAAEKNKKIFGNDKIFFYHADASSFQLPAGRNFVFLFNPFDEYILAKFIEKNIDSFRKNHSLLAYANDHHRLCLARLGFSVIYRSQSSCCSLHQYI